VELPVLSVVFDDGSEYKVEAKARDLLAAERAGHPFDAERPMGSLYAIAHAALGRLQRAGEIPADVVLPASVDDLAEVADVAGVEEDPKG
jgi:hypothetical protein